MYDSDAVRHVCRRAATGLLLILSAACAQDDAPGAASPEAEVVGAEELAPLPPDAALGGTAWQLDRIQFMDDRVVVPDDRSKYSISFGSDGRASIRADCNHGSGNWTSEGSGLSFGPLALTRAMCPPDSLHDTFIAQLDYVRSYIINDGRLHLATMADGSILEFERIAE